MDKPHLQYTQLDLDLVFQRVNTDWEQLREKKIFITGGTGFVGTWLLAGLLQANDRLNLQLEIHTLTRDAVAFRRRCRPIAEHPAVHLLQGDLGSFRFPSGAFYGLIHAAVETEPPLLTFRHTLEGAIRLVDFCEQSGIQRILFTSSGAVYGRQALNVDQVREEHTCAPPTQDPSSAYGQAKRCSEFLFSTFGHASGVQVAIARCFAFVGPGLPLDANYAIGNFIRDALRKGPICIQGDGTALRSYLYAADLAAWLWSLFLRGPYGQPVNVGSDQAISILELARTVARVLAPGLRIEVAGVPVHGRLPERYVPSLVLARSHGLEPWTSLEEGIARTAEWHRQHGSISS